MIINKTTNNKPGVIVNLDELLSSRNCLRKIKSHKYNGNINIGIKKSLRRGRGMHCTDVRHYSTGDELRHMSGVQQLEQENLM